MAACAPCAARVLDSARIWAHSGHEGRRALYAAVLLLSATAGVVDRHSRALPAARGAGQPTAGRDAGRAPDRDGSGFQDYHAVERRRLGDGMGYSLFGSEPE